jgi:cell division protein FtsQ
MIGEERPSWPNLPDLHLSRLMVIAALAVFASLAVTGIGYATWRSTAFRVSTVVVEGNLRVAADDIVAMGDLSGESLVTADFSQHARRIAALPLIKDVKLDRNWPRTVRIRVIERQPWGTWEQQGVRYSIDRDGVVMGTVATIPPPDGAPIIRSSQLGTRVQGDRVDADAVEAAARIVQELPAIVGVHAREVAFLAGRGLVVTTEDGKKALLGDSKAIDYKLAAWAAVDAHARDERISYDTIDLRAGNRPVISRGEPQ